MAELTSIEASENGYKIRLNGNVVATEANYQDAKVAAIILKIGYFEGRAQAFKEQGEKA